MFNTVPSEQKPKAVDNVFPQFIPPWSAFTPPANDTVFWFHCSSLWSVFSHVSTTQRMRCVTHSLSLSCRPLSQVSPVPTSSSGPSQAPFSSSHSSWLLQPGATSKSLWESVIRLHQLWPNKDRLSVFILVDLWLSEIMWNEKRHFHTTVGTTAPPSGMYSS